MLRTSRVRAMQLTGALACGIMLLALAACSGPVNTDNTVVIRDISVTPSLLEQGQVAVVEVLVTTEAGDPIANKTVYLVAEPSTRGAFSNSMVETDANGLATVTFTAAQAGDVTITASAQGASTTMNTNVKIEDNAVTTGNGQIILSITPGLIQADGISSAVVTATVADRDGNPLPDSTVVKFTAGEKFVDNNGDGFWTSNIDSLVYDIDGDDQWDPIGNITSNVFTQNGQATAQYTSGYSAGLVYIKATVGEPGSQVSQDVSLALTSSDSVNTIVLTPDWQQIQVRGTGGIEWVRLVAEGFDSYGDPAPEGLPIDFNITAGPGGGEALNGDPIGPVTILTNSLGRAEITLNAGTISGTVRLRARAGAVVSAATQVTIRSGPPAFISMGSDDCNTPSWEHVNWTNKITAVVVDQWGNEVPDSTSVWFGCEQGLIEGARETEVIPTFRGVASTYWHSGVPKNDGYVYYWCETSGGTVADTSVFIESGPAATGTFLQYPDTLWADGDDHGEVIVQVLDVNGVFVDTDYPIEVKSDLGSIGSGLVNDGCHSSVYIQDFYSQQLDRDFYYTIPDSGIGAIATISVRAGGITGYNGSAQVVFKTGGAYSKNSAIDMQSTVTYGASVPIEVTIKDRWGNPLGGHLIEVHGDGIGGSVSGSPRYTDSYGVASGFTFTATTNKAVTQGFVTVNDLDPNFGGISLSNKISFEE